MLKYIIFLSFLGSNLLAQETDYKLLNDIEYRDLSEDFYVKERCKLDIYLSLIHI